LYEYFAEFLKFWAPWKIRARCLKYPMDLPLNAPVCNISKPSISYTSMLSCSYTQWNQWKHCNSQKSALVCFIEEVTLHRNTSMSCLGLMNHVNFSLFGKNKNNNYTTLKKEKKDRFNKSARFNFNKGLQPADFEFLNSVVVYLLKKLTVILPSTRTFIIFMRFTFQYFSVKVNMLQEIESAKNRNSFSYIYF